MKRFLWVWLVLTGMFGGVLEARAQPLPISVRILGQPADVLCAAAAKKPVTLLELARLVEKHYKLQVVIDEQAFQKEAPQVDLTKARFLVPQERGLRLSTVLHYCLENELPVRATFKIGNQTIVIHPGTTQVLEGLEEQRDGRMGKLLNGSVITSATGFNGLLGDVLGRIQNGTGLVILVAKRQFTEAGEEQSILLKQVKVPRQAKAPAAQVLQQILDQVNARYLVKDDHLLIVPKDKRK